MADIIKILYKKLILFLVGYCAYIAIEISFRGISFTLMGILAGFAIIILDSLNNYFGWDFDLILQGMIGSVLITFCELILGEFIRVNEFLPVMWDYSNVPINYDGVICLPFSILWIAMSFVAIFLSDAINYYVLKEDGVPYYKIFGIEVLRFKERS